MKALVRVLALFVPLPVFWALFDQQGSGWTFMARRMNGSIGFYTILPDQMQVVNPLLILAFIPLFQYCIYPLLNKCHILRTPLQRLVAGGALAALSFVVSAVICLALESTYPVLPGPGNGQIRIYNGLKCDIEIRANGLSKEVITIPKLESYTKIDIPINNVARYPYSLTSECSTVTGGEFEVLEFESSAYFFDQINKGAGRYKDDVDKSSNGNPLVR